MVTMSRLWVECCHCSWGKKTPGLQECDGITGHLVGIYCPVAGLFQVFARNRNVRWLFQSPEASEANDVRTRPDSGCTISRNRTHHPISLNFLLGNPVTRGRLTCVFFAKQFQLFVIGIWWGRVGQRCGRCEKRHGSPSFKFAKQCPGDTGWSIHVSTSCMQACYVDILLDSGLYDGYMFIILY